MTVPNIDKATDVRTQPRKVRSFAAVISSEPVMLLVKAKMWGSKRTEVISTSYMRDCQGDLTAPGSSESQKTFMIMSVSCSIRIGVRVVDL